MSGVTKRFDEAVRLSVQLQLSTHLLFVVFVCSIGAVLVTNDAALPEKFLLYFALPLFIIDLATQTTLAARVRVREPIAGLFKSWILWIAAAYFLVLITSTVASSGLQPAMGHRIREYIRWSAELLLFIGITAHLAVAYRDFFKRLFFIVGACLAVNAVVNIAMFLETTPRELILPSRFSASFATPSYRNATHIAPLYAVYAMALLGLLATTKLAIWERVVGSVFVVVLMAGVVLTQSRGALGAAVIVALLIASVSTKGWRIAVAGALLASLVALWSFPMLREAVLARGTSTRPDLWKAYLDLAKLHPWLGYGLERILELKVAGWEFEQPHNTIIWAQLRGGVFAAALATCLTLASLFATLRWWLKTANIAPLAAVLVLSIVSLTEIGFLVYPYSWLWVVFWLPVALAAGAERAIRDQPAVGGIRMRSFPERSPQYRVAPFGDRISERTPTAGRQRRAAVLITGASSGIGAIYAERFAQRGHDLVLVARDRVRLQRLAAKLHALTGVAVDILPADLTDSAQLARVEARLRSDDRIGILINNAGAAAPGSLAKPDLDAAEKLIDLNVTAVVRLSGAVIPRFLAESNGAIVNVSSALALVPEAALGIYGATKSFVLAFSQNMQAELGPQGIYVQAVLPAATATEIWERSGRDPSGIANMMDVEVLVDAALVGFDRREAITIPSLPDLQQWETYEAARRAMAPNFRQSQPAVRYRSQEFQTNLPHSRFPVSK